MADDQRNDAWSLENEEILKNNFAVHCACRDGDTNTLNYLINRKLCPLELEDCFYGWTALHWSAYFGKLTCMRILVDEGMAVDCKTSAQMQTACHIAAFAGHPHCLNFLLQSNADINIKDYIGETPIHKAARTCSVECLSLMLKYTPDLTMKNNSGQTADEVAESCGHLDCSNYLKNAVLLTLSHSVDPTLSANVSCNSVTTDSLHCHTLSNTACHDGSRSAQAAPVHTCGDVLMSVAVGRNMMQIAGVKRPREDAEDVCWKKIKHGESECDICNDRANVNSVLLSYNAVLSSSVRPLILESAPYTSVTSQGRLFF